MMRRELNAFTGYIKSFWDFNRNCKLSFSANLLNGLSQGIFMVAFNLYILEMGIKADVLGGILSAGPLAQAIGSIPLGFLAEKIGFRKVFLLIYGISGIAKLVQVSGSNVALISGAAFMGGLLLAGDFVVRISFLAANTEPHERTRVYSLNSMIFAASMSGGALLAGFLPTLFQVFTLDLVLAYRYTLLIAGLLSLVALVPSLRMTETPPATTRRISLSPYLWGIDRFTVQQAIVSLAVGLSIGMISPFMNLYFVYHLGTTREFFGSVSALAVFFTMAATSLGPLVARRLGMVPSVTYLRFIIPVFLIGFTMTTNPLVGAGAFCMQSALFQMTQPLSFAFAMRAASEKAKSAASAWLNVTFWLGNGIAAPIVGALIVRADYRTPLILAAQAVAIAGILNFVFFNSMESRLNKADVIPGASEVKTS